MFSFRRRRSENLKEMFVYIKLLRLNGTIAHTHGSPLDVYTATVPTER
jgi:hypothetical protein